MNGFILYKGVWISESAPHTQLELKLSDCKAMLNKGGYAIRNAYDFDKVNDGSFWYVIKDSFGGMEELSTNTRNQVRKCLKQCDIHQVTKDELLKKGYEVHSAAASGYKVKTHVPTTEEFRNGILKKNQEYEYWAAYIKDTDKMIAFSINRVHENCCEYSTMKAIPEMLRQYYPFYGLLYEMNRYYLEKRGLMYVNDGARSLTNHSNIQPFLIEKFKFRKAYGRMQVVYKPWVKIVVNMLYPFRSIIPNLKIRSFLNMEAIRRGDI